MRALVVIVCVFCVATLITEGLAAGLLWWRGQLTVDTVRDIRMLLSGQNTEIESESEEATRLQPALSDVVRERTLRILELDTRAGELALLNETVTARSQELLQRRIEIEKERREFEERLRQLQTEVASQAVEQGRAILMAARPDDAVNNLMPLELQENVILLRGMPEKSIAEILEEFANGTEDQRKRGQQIFEAITRGGPAKELIDGSLEELTLRESN